MDGSDGSGVSGERAGDGSDGSLVPQPPPFDLSYFIYEGDATPKVELSDFPLHPASVLSVTAGGMGSLGGGEAEDPAKFADHDAALSYGPSISDPQPLPSNSYDPSISAPQPLPSNKKRSRDDDQTIEDTERKTMRDASCQTDDPFTEVETRDQSGDTVGMTPIQMTYPTPGLCWHPMNPLRQVFRPTMLEPWPWTGDGQFSPPRGSTCSVRWIVGSTASNVPTHPTNKRAPPPCCSPYPEGHDLNALKGWNKQCREVSILAAEDPLYKLPFLEKYKFPSLEQPKEVVSKSDKILVDKVASSLVNVSSVDKDGVVVLQCTGVIIGPFKESGPPIVLTTSNIICDASGNLLHHKVLIRQDNDESDGNILFYDSYYKIAFLGISNGCLSARPSLLSTLEFGDKVFVISIDGNSSLTARKGKVLCFEKSYLGRNFYKYLSCKLPKCCVGGPVVDNDGNIGGMALIVGIPSPTIVPSSIIVKCIEMYKKFGRVARPDHGLSLRTLECLDVTTKRGIMVAHKIKTGYIVDKVLVESDADKFDIRLGDIIVLFNGMDEQPLLELELYFLSLGCEFLEKKLDSGSKVIIELKVYDPLAHHHRSITLPIGFSSSGRDNC